MQGLLRTFERFDIAQQAHAALLAAGFAASQLHLVSNADEAGPVEGNFLVGNGRDADPGDAASDPPPSGADSHYQRNFARTVDGGSCRLAVDVRDETEREKAGQLLDALGGVDIEARIAGSGPAGR